MFYAGNRVFCPWCGGRFRAFIQYRAYVKPGLNTYCSKCYSFERQRLLWLFFNEKTKIFTENLRILHFAPEYMVQKKLKALPNLKYVSIDIDSSLAMLSSDITNLPFSNCHFDIVLCSHVLEHVIDDMRAMREIYRVLRENGFAIILSPIDLTKEQTFEDFSVTSPQERERLFGQHDHVRLYGRDVTHRLEQAGFTVKIDYFARELDNAIIAKYNLNRDEKIFVCTK